VTTCYDEDIFATEDIIHPIIIKNPENARFGIEVVTKLMEVTYSYIPRFNTRL
jgi:hypothetical protein